SRAARDVPRRAATKNGWATSTTGPTFLCTGPVVSVWLGSAPIAADDPSSATSSQRRRLNRCLVTIPFTVNRLIPASSPPWQRLLQSVARIGPCSGEERKQP